VRQLEAGSPSILMAEDSVTSMKTAAVQVAEGAKAFRAPTSAGTQDVAVPTLVCPSHRPMQHDGLLGRWRRKRPSQISEAHPESGQPRHAYLGVLATALLAVVPGGCDSAGRVLSAAPGTTSRISSPLTRPFRHQTAAEESWCLQVALVTGGGRWGSTVVSAPPKCSPVQVRMTG